MTNANFLTLEGVMAVFNNEIGVYLGWMHYVVFDALVARWIMLDSIEEKNCSVILHVLLVVPCMFFCIMGIRRSP